MHIRVFFRYLRNQPLAAFVNVFSYALGIATCLLLVQHIYFETSFESFYEDKSKVYRLTMDSYHSGAFQASSASTFTPVAASIKGQAEELEYITTIERTNGILFVDENTFIEKGILAVDEDFFNVFPQTVVEGQISSVVPNDIFVSERMALKYFPDKSPIGKVIQIYSVNYTIKAVFKDLPPNTHLKFEIVYIVPPRPVTDWNVAYMQSYVKLKGNERKFQDYLEKVSGELSPLADAQSEAEYTFQLKTQPIADIHLKSNLLSEFEVNGSTQDVSIISVITILILLVSCMNYVSMTNATNIERSKETFVRALHGATPRHRILQRITEATVISFLGFIAAFALLVIFVTLVDPYFEFSLVKVDLTNPSVYYTLFSILVATLVLSSAMTGVLNLSNRITLAQSSNLNPSTMRVGFSRNLAFTQFLLSSILIAVSVIVLKQISFLRDAGLGFSYSGVIALETNPLSYRNNETHFLKLKNDLEGLAAVDKVSFSNAIPGEKLFGVSVRRIDQTAQDIQNANVQIITSDYLDTYSISLASGRAFEEERPGDENSVLINETLAKRIAAGDVARILDTEIVADYMRRLVTFKVVGIVKDYFHDSKMTDIQPMLFIPLKNSNGVFRVSMKAEIPDGDSWRVLSDAINNAMEANLLQPYSTRGIGVAYNVMDAKGTYIVQFRDEEHFSKLLNSLTFLTLVMSAIGFFSLSAVVARKRTKEVAIRKVHGADTSQMAFLMIRYFLGIAGIAIIIALPVSYFIVSKWLSNFKAQVGIDAWFVLWPLIITSFLIVASVSYHLWRLAVVNPINHLRQE